MTAKTLYMLIGPKGSGKTTIGALIDAHTDMHVIRVEPIWLSLQAGEDGWRKVEATIDAAFARCDKVMIESLGAGDAFRAFHASLKRKYMLKMIRVYADLDTCLARVKRRDSADHIAVSDDQVEQYNRIAAGVVYDWDLEIDNNGPASDADVLAAIDRL
jgi:shikimate kinase